MKKGPRILIVEDDGIIAEDLSESLGRLGYANTVVAHSGKRAVELSADVQPDIILMDIKLRGPMDGIEAARHIRKEAQVPIIYLTANADQATVERAKVTEPFGFLLKPYKAEEVASTIEVALFRSQMEQRLRASERWLASTLRDISAAVITANPNGCINFMNPVAEQLTGFPAGQALGKPVHDAVRIVHQETGDPVECPIAKALRLGQVVGLPHNTVLVNQAGVRIPIDDSAAPIRDEAGNITGAVMVFRDATRFKEAEERLRQSQKMEAVGRLAAGVANDFNNLLTIILGYSAQILADCKDDLLRTRATEIRNAGDRAQLLTRQLLAIGRRQAVDSEVLDLRTLLEESRRFFTLLLDTNIDLRIRIGGHPGLIRADRGQIYQLLMDLVVNARDAMPTGGVLTLEVDNVALNAGLITRTTMLPPGDYVRLTVTDTGCGMDVATLDRIFEPFFTTKEVGKGVGLGLASVYGILQQCNAGISIETAPGQGCTFRAYFPGEYEATAAPVPDLAGEPGRGKSETILLADDEPAVRQMVGEILSDFGYAVLQASNGVEAVEIAGRHAGPIDLLLTDVNMPRMKGQALAREMALARPNARILYMSGYGESIDLPSGSHFVQKPFSPHDIARKVRQVLDSEGRGDTPVLA